ncbi:hypothetical protein C0560_07820 [Lelliottia sp. AC1]|nr:hypothetical protein DAI21_18885 [Lelliottia sp. WB101]UQC70702.1 hypothetical protein C0560_07820 [Lelliottia sp. AC1]
MSHSLMTDVINGKNKKGLASYKVVLPIFTQHLKACAGALFQRNPFQQNEYRFDEFNQINIL